MWPNFGLFDLTLSAYLLIAVVCSGLWIRHPKWSDPPRFKNLWDAVLIPILIALIWPLELLLNLPRYIRLLRKALR